MQQTDFYGILLSTAKKYCRHTNAEANLARNKHLFNSLHYASKKQREHAPRGRI